MITKVIMWKDDAGRVHERRIDAAAANRDLKTRSSKTMWTFMISVPQGEKPDGGYRNSYDDYRYYLPKAKFPAGAEEVDGYIQWWYSTSGSLEQALKKLEKRFMRVKRSNWMNWQVDEDVFMSEPGRAEKTVNLQDNPIWNHINSQ